MSSLEFFSPEAQEALDQAKRAVAKGEQLTPELLLAATFHVGELAQEIPQLAPYLPPPVIASDEIPEQVTVNDALQPILRQLSNDDMVTLNELMLALIGSEPGRELLRSRGASDDELGQVEAELRSAEGLPVGDGGLDQSWRASEEREEALEALSSFGRMLTVGQPPNKGVVEIDDYIRRLQKILLKMKRANVIVIGHPGTGKTALVYEFARRIMTGDPSIHPKLRDRDVFELSPSFLRSGASMVGEYDERVSALLKVLEANPKIILFVDEVHSLLQSGIHQRGPFTDANESFKQVLGRGGVSFIGATTTAEYRHHIAPDGALARRFGLLKIDPPSPEATHTMLVARLGRYRKHYDPLHIPEEILQRVVDLTEEMQPTEFQPAKSIRLLDEACAACEIEGEKEVTEQAVINTLQDAIGHPLVRPETLTVKAVHEDLTSKIVGQDQPLQQIATKLVAGLAEDWRDRDQPRGIMFFCGPTGVGKTETAKKMAKILGGGREALVRVDCNTLQGKYGDEGPIINILLGVPPGYIGYVRGKGGVLSKVRDIPESIVLFDEIEKAHPALGKILLQILDEGRVYDHDDNLLDFRRSFIVFTTNAGCTYESGSAPGFKPSGGLANVAGEPTPTVSVEDVQEDLRRQGMGEEFLGRNIDYIVFEGMERDDIEVVLGRQLAGLRETAELRGTELEFSPEVVDHLLSAWEPRFGVRFLTTILRNRVVEQLAIADAQGELRGIDRIRLEVMSDPPEPGGLPRRRIEGDTLIISLP